MLVLRTLLGGVELRFLLGGDCGHPRRGFDRFVESRLHLRDGGVRAASGSGRATGASSATEGAQRICSCHSGSPCCFTCGSSGVGGTGSHLTPTPSPPRSEKSHHRRQCWSAKRRVEAVREWRQFPGIFHVYIMENQINHVATRLYRNITFI